ncbi:MAG TPA: VWA domain-containing protein [Bryobacteraceae bacterium]|nr:VWA domain-containing protein [Bryobacteraceae bacterium]
MLQRTLVLLALIAGAHGQQIGQNAPAERNAPATFSATSQLVVETVNVKDKSGKPVLGLTAKSFTVTEDGVPQDIRFFEFQKLPEADESEPAIAKPAAPFRTLPEAQIATERPGNLRYQDRRLMVFYFDLTAMPPQDQIRAVAAAKKFIRSQMTPADRVALMRFEGGSVRVMSDFTGDRDRLDSILETMIVGEAQGFDETGVDDSAPDTGAAFGQDDSEFNIFNTNRQLSALQTAANMLAHVSEKKSLLYFASGLRLNGLDNHAQLQATTNAAIRAGVQIWPIDARGLVAEAPLGDATQGSPGGRGMYTGASALALTSRFQQSQDTLFALAADTGGKALLDNNDLSRGIVQAQNSVASYYLIGYYTTNVNLDGKFRRIKISLNNGLSASLDYRQGYFAGKTFGKFTSAEKERQLEDALMLGDPITELTIAMEIDYFQLNRAEYFVPVVVKIPGRELALARKGGAERTLIDFIGEIKDDYGTTIGNVRDKADIKLSGETAARLAKQPIEYDTGFTLLPGKYKIKLLARDAETGRIGTYETPFVIPNLNKELKRIPTSSVVLSSQRVDLKDAIYNALKSKDQAELTNPLVQERQKLIPSVTRVFSKSRPMYVYLQAYEPGVTDTQPLVAFVTFYRGSSKVFETPPRSATEALSSHLRTLPLRFDLSLDQLSPGAYECQVTVLDPAAQKAAFWRAPVVVIE